MNLHGIVSRYIGAVNPLMPATLKVSLGNVVNPDGSQTPQYRSPIQNVVAQVQALTANDIQKIEGLNLQGNQISIYLNGEVDGIVRVSNKGGDLITIPSGTTKGIYLVTAVLEQWPDWVKVTATLQNDPGVIR